MSQATLHVLQTCPFSWKVRGLVEHLGLDVAEVQVNAMRTKKELSFTNGWNKVPVFTDENGEVVVDSTPIMVYIDEKYNNSVLTQSSGEERYDSMLAHVDEAWKRATIPILYGSLGAALSTTRRFQNSKSSDSSQEGSTHGQDSRLCGESSLENA